MDKTCRVSEADCKQQANFVFQMKNMKTFLITLLTTISLNLIAQDSVREAHLNLEGGVAIQGYDPVAYFQEGEAVEGDKRFQFEYMGIPYRFKSAHNLELFKSNPEKYEPAYGGWCAYAMGATGDKVKIDPETFKIVDGELNLFYNFFFNNTLKDWNKDEDNLKSAARSNWSEIYKE